MAREFGDLPLEPGSVITAQDTQSGEAVHVTIHHLRAETGDGPKVLASLDGKGKRLIVLEPDIVVEGGVKGHLRFPGLASREPALDSKIDSSL